MKKGLKWFVYISIPVWIVVIAVVYKADIPVGELKKKYASEASQFVEVDGMQVHYRDEGNALDTVPLVLIHGTAASLHTWDTCTKEWIKNHRVIRFDLPAFGLTGPNAENDYSMERYSEFVNQLLKKLNINHCYLVGNSLGGRITWEYTLRHPEKVEKMILVDASGYTFDSDNAGTLAFILGKTPVLKNLLKYLMSRSVIEKSVKTAYADDEKVNDVLVDRYMDLALREGNRSAFVARLTKRMLLQMD